MRTLQHLIIGLVVIAIPNFGFSQEIDYTQFKTSDEENNIDIFKLASPSVVHITNSRLFRSFASLLLQITAVRMLKYLFQKGGSKNNQRRQKKKTQRSKLQAYKEMKLVTALLFGVVTTANAAGLLGGAGGDVDAVIAQAASGALAANMFRN